MDKTQHLGYRDEYLFGEGYTDPIEISYHETFELENSDIAEHIMHNFAHMLTKDEARACEDIIRANRESTEMPEGAQVHLRRALVRILDGRDFAKWLCATARDVADSYIAPFDDAEAMMADSYVSVFVIPEDAIALTDESDPEGTLWAWRADGENTLPIRELPMKDALGVK